MLTGRLDRPVPIAGAARGPRSCCAAPARALSLAAWLILLLATGLAAQETPPAAPPRIPLRPPVPELPGEVEPKVYVVEDKDGKFQHVPGFMYEDFMELYKLKNHLAQQSLRPRYTLQNLSITGAAGAERAELRMELAIDLGPYAGVSVPLRLGNAVLRQIKHTGPGESILSWEGSSGYVCWLSGDPANPNQSSKHKLTLDVSAPIVVLGAESRLRISLPRATQSDLKIEAPGKLLGSVSDNTAQLHAQTAGAKTEFNVIGVGGEFDLVWRKVDSSAPATPTVMEANGSAAVRIDGRSVNCEAKLSVRSFGGPFDHFRVRLPVGAELLTSPQPGITVSPVMGENATNGRLVECKLDKQTTGPIEVRLITERLHNGEQGNSLLELAGFEVLDAVRQWGYVAVQSVGNWQIVWGERRNVRQVDELPESLRADNLIAGFEYSSQPFSLTLRVLPQKTRVSVDPQYVFLVGANRVQMTARFKYKVRGAKVRNLGVDWDGWEIDEVGPPNLVDQDAVLAGDSAQRSIPLSQPLSGEFELVVQAHRNIAADAKTVDWQIPRLEAEAVSQAAVAIVPADNVELTPRGKEIEGLAAQLLRPVMKLPERQQEPLFFRGETALSKFAADFVVHEQQITAAVNSQIEVDLHELRVDERIAYQVSHEPIDRLTLELSRVVNSERLQISLDGLKITPIALRDEADPESNGPAKWRVPLASPRIGRFELHVTYSVGQEKLLPDSSVPVTAPLAMPLDGKLTENQLVVSSKAGITVSLRKTTGREAAGWTASTQARSGAVAGATYLTSKHRTAEAPLAVTFKERRSEGSTVVERAWIQSWFTSSARLDRAVYRLTTSQPRLQITLPEGTVTQAVDVSLDGVAVSPEIERSGVLNLPMPAPTAPREHLIELRYYLPSQRASSLLAIAGPQFDSDIWVRRLYWQVVLPAEEHVVRRPAQFTSEFTWAWSGGLWQREPSWNQTDLESWLGASHAAPLPVSANCYLFSAVAAGEQLRLWTARLSVLIFIASLFVLLLGLGLIYVPRLRHPAALLVLAVAVLSVSLWDPEAAVLLAQAATLGLLLALVAYGLARRGVIRRAVIVPVRSSSQSLGGSGSTELFQRAARSGSQPSTATAPIAVQAYSPESKS